MKRLSPKILAALGFGAVVAVTLIGWFLVVSPQRSRAAKLDGEIANARIQLAAAKLSAHAGDAGKADLAKYRQLQVAMPDTADAPTMLRELLRAARIANVRVDSITAQPRKLNASYDAVPMDVSLTGRFPGIRRFLYTLRTQVATTTDGVHVTGRLFTIDGLDFAPGEDELPQLTATVHLSAFVYHSPPPPPSAVAPPATTASAAGRTS